MRYSDGYSSKNGTLDLGTGISTLKTNGPVLDAGGDLNGIIDGQAVKWASLS